MDKIKILNDIIDKQISKHQEINLEDLEKKLRDTERNYIKYQIKNGRVFVEQLQPYKKRRINAVTNFLKCVVKKYKSINTTIYCDLCDWSNNDMSKEPIFVFSAMKNTNNFVIPDYLFLQDYSKRSGRNSDNDSHDNMVLKYRNKIKFEDKESKCFFRAGTSKNKVIINMFNNSKHVDACYSKKKWMEYEDMFKHRYVISHYMKWDSVYYFLKSDILTFLYSGFKTYLWYDLFLKDNVHYCSFETINDFNKHFEYFENNVDKAKEMIEKSSKIVDDFFNMDTAIDYMGILLLKYQKLVI